MSESKKQAVEGTPSGLRGFCNGECPMTAQIGVKTWGRFFEG
jgi:hypothetical protein